MKIILTYLLLIGNLIAIEAKQPITTGWNNYHDIDYYPYIKEDVLRTVNHIYDTSDTIVNNSINMYGSVIYTLPMDELKVLINIDKTIELNDILPIPLIKSLLKDTKDNRETLRVLIYNAYGLPIIIDKSLAIIGNSTKIRIVHDVYKFIYISPVHMGDVDMVAIHFT